MKKNFSGKAVALLLAGGLLAGATVGGTLAWLTATTKTVTNAFTVGDIDIQLTEEGTSADTNGNLVNSSFKILPGTYETKEPKVTVAKGSEACWLFVEITENNNYVKEDGTYTNKKFIDWKGNLGGTNWKILSPNGTPSAAQSVTYVYYIEQPAVTGEAVSYYVLNDLDGNSTNTNGEVGYSSTLTKEELEQAKTAKPSLTFKAYAIQSDALKDGSGDINEAARAWAQISK